MNRSGAYVQQQTGYKAFIPDPLLPNPPVKIEGELQNLLSKADMSLARLDGLFEFESGKKPDNVNDVDEVVNFIKALLEKRMIA